MVKEAAIAEEPPSRPVISLQDAAWPQLNAPI